MEQQLIMARLERGLLLKTLQKFKISYYPSDSEFPTASSHQDLLFQKEPLFYQHATGFQFQKNRSVATVPPHKGHALEDIHTVGVGGGARRLRIMLTLLPHMTSSLSPPGVTASLSLAPACACLQQPTSNYTFQRAERAHRMLSSRLLHAPTTLHSADRLSLNIPALNQGQRSESRSFIVPSRQ
jgi:hypothetical protein